MTRRPRDPVVTLNGFDVACVGLFLQALERVLTREVAGRDNPSAADVLVAMLADPDACEKAQAVARARGWTDAAPTISRWRDTLDTIEYGALGPEQSATLRGARLQ